MDINKYLEQTLRASLFLSLLKNSDLRKMALDVLFFVTTRRAARDGLLHGGLLHRDVGRLKSLQKSGAFWELLTKKQKVL